MNKKTLAIVFAVFVLAAADASAQYPLGAAGFLWTGSSGAVAGTFCWGFSCTPYPVNVTAGESVTVRITGEGGAPYAIFVSPTATNCQSFPNVLNSLVLDLTPSILSTGYLLNFSPILSCPNAYAEVTGTLPPIFPIGTTFAIQGLTYGAGFVPAFTSAIVATVI